MRKLKQVIVVRKDLNMPAGKMASQVAHASLGAILQIGQFGLDTFTLYLDESNEDWLRNSFTKVVLWCEDLDEMLELEKKAIEMNLPTFLCEDEGRTVFDGEPTITTLGIGCHFSDTIDMVTGHLELVR